MKWGSLLARLFAGNRPSRRRTARNQAPRLDVVQLESRVNPAPFGQIQHFVVIYEENWDFDGLYGNFPGANGLQNANASNTTQIAPNGSTISTTPAALNPAASGTNPGTKDRNLPTGNGQSALPAGPYNLNTFISPSTKTGDIIHAFYTEQLEIGNGIFTQSRGNQAGFFSYSDNPGLTQSNFNATNLPEGQLAQQYTMNDNFFHSAYGGSYLNHQFLVSAAAPQWNQPLPTITSPTAKAFTSNPSAEVAAATPGTTDNHTPSFYDSNLSAVQPNGKQYTVNTTFSSQLSPTTFSVAKDQLLNPINDNNPNGPGYQQNIGDLLSNAGVSWKWYSEDFATAVDSVQRVKNGATAASDPVLAADITKLNTDVFQWHHQPFAYYANTDPLSPNGQAHLQDGTNFLSDLASNNLPAVSFYKPVGVNNEHPGYADLQTGQQNVARLVSAIQNSPAWSSTAIIITYDEHGGRWDHVTPNMTDAVNGIVWGDGQRVPSIVISPFAKRGYVDHTQHDTSSILKTIEERFTLPSLNKLDGNANDLSTDFQFGSAQYYATSSDGNGAVNVYNTATNQLITSFSPFQGFNGGVRTAVGDVNGDGIADLIVSAGRGGGPQVKVYDGASILSGSPALISGPLSSFFAFPATFSGGVSVAAADFNHDGYADIVVGAGQGGGPEVKVFDGKTGAQVTDFFAFNAAFQGGVSLATGDVNADGFADLAVGAGSGGGPEVKIFDGKQLGLGNPTLVNAPMNDFYAYDPNFKGGVSVALDWLNTTGHAVITTGAGAGGAPQVKQWDAVTGALTQNFLAFDGSFNGGVRVQTGQLAGDNARDLILTPGVGGSSQLKVLKGTTLQQLNAFFAMDPAQRNGAYSSSSSS